MNRVSRSAYFMRSFPPTRQGFPTRKTSIYHDLIYPALFAYLLIISDTEAILQKIPVI
jgi:hypothetical protein